MYPETCRISPPPDGRKRMRSRGRSIENRRSARREPIFGERQFSAGVIRPGRIAGFLMLVVVPGSACDCENSDAYFFSDISPNDIIFAGKVVEVDSGSEFRRGTLTVEVISSYTKNFVGDSITITGGYGMECYWPSWHFPPDSQFVFKCESGTLYESPSSYALNICRGSYLEISGWMVRLTRLAETSFLTLLQFEKKVEFALRALR